MNATEEKLLLCCAVHTVPLDRSRYSYITTVDQHTTTSSLVLNRDEVVLRCNVGLPCSTTGEKHIFQRFAYLRYGRGHVEAVEGLEYLAHPIHRQREVRHDFLDDWCRDREKKHRLEMELQNAEWTLGYEKRLAALQKKTAAQRSKAGQAGINTDRLRKLEHHLAGLRRSLD